MSKIQKAVNRKPRIIRIADADGDSKYDVSLIAPSQMTLTKAVKEEDTAIRKVKELYPGEYMFEDLLKILKPKGFVYPAWEVATETW